jgi:hypothetical protein
MKYTLIITILSLLLLVGCGAAENPSAEPTFAALPKEFTPEQNPDKPDDLPIPPTGNPEGFPFIYDGVTIYVGAPAEPVLRQLGEPLNYFEAPSCAFEGIDKTYFFSGIELHTFPMGDNDYVLAVVFTDDSVETPEGVYLGMPVVDALSRLGSGFEQDGGKYTFVEGRGSLGVMTEHGIVVDISYNFILR